MHKVYLVEPKYSYDGKGLIAAMGFIIQECVKWVSFRNSI